MLSNVRFFSYFISHPSASSISKHSPLIYSTENSPRLNVQDTKHNAELISERYLNAIESHQSNKLFWELQYVLGPRPEIRSIISADRRWNWMKNEREVKYLQIVWYKHRGVWIVIELVSEVIYNFIFAIIHCPLPSCTGLVGPWQTWAQRKEDLISVNAWPPCCGDCFALKLRANRGWEMERENIANVLG